MNKTPVGDPALYSDYEAIRAIDPALLSLLFGFLEEKRYHFDRDVEEIFHLHKGVERFSWRAESRGIFMSSRDPSKNVVSAAIHPAAHALVYFAFGGGEWGFPRLNLLGEAVASALDFYTLLRAREAVAKKKLSRPAGEAIGKELFLTYGLAARRVGIDFPRFLRRHARTPFESFRGAIREQHRLYLSFLESWNDGEEMAVRKISRRVAGCELIPYLAFNDYTNNLLYTVANYGRRSCGADREGERELLALLDAATSAHGFFEGLGELARARRRG